MKLRLKKLRAPARVYLFLAATAAAISLLLFRLGSLLPGMAPQEMQLPSVHDSLTTLWSAPLALPYTLSQLVVVVVLPTDGMTASRLPSVLLGFVLMGLAYWLIRKWYGYRLALFGSILLITAPWLLHVSRVATIAVLYPLSMTILLVLAALWHQPTRRAWLLYASAIAFAVLLYTPGMAWLIPVLLIFERRNILATVSANRLHASLASIIGLAALVPLIHAFAVDWHIYRAWLAIPVALPTITQYLQQFVSVWSHIFLGGYHAPVYNLGGLPIVDILISLAFVVGIYLYGQHRKAVRTRELLCWWLLGTALIALGGDVAISLVLPIVFVMAVGGIGYLLHLWLKVFPRNPLARSFGIGLVALVVAFAVAYNVRNYYVAWPHNHTTKTAFSRQL